MIHLVLSFKGNEAKKILRKEVVVFLIFMETEI
jgi:hypothetical protein